MQATRLLCVMFAMLPVMAAAQSVSTQPARQRDGASADTRDSKQRSGSVDTREASGSRDNKQRSGSVDTRETNGSRDGSRAESAQKQYNSPGKSGSSQGKKGEAPGQEKKSGSKSKNKNKK